MAFVPPVFSNFGKACSDLITKKWEAGKNDFKNQFSVKSKSQGITLTSTLISEEASQSQVSAKVNVGIVDKRAGEGSVEFNTNNKIKGTAKVTNLYKGLVANNEAEYNGSVISNKTKFEYTNEPVALTLEYNTNKNIIASGAVGFEGLSAGVQSNIDINKLDNKNEAINLEAGLQYEDGNLVGTFKIEKNYNVSISLFHRVSNALQVAAKVAVASKGTESAVTVAGQYAVNKDTLVKGKADVDAKNTVLSTFVEHRLANPSVVVGVSQQYSVAAKSCVFGFNVAAGEV